MSKHNLDNDFEYQNRVDKTRIRLIDTLERVSSTAFCGGWSGIEEDDAVAALEDALALLNEWREKNSSRKPNLAIVPDDYVAISKHDLTQILCEAGREGGRVPSRQEIVKNADEVLQDDENVICAERGNRFPSGETDTPVGTESGR